MGPSERDLGVRCKTVFTVAASLVNDLLSRIRKGMKGVGRVRMVVLLTVKWLFFTGLGELTAVSPERWGRRWRRSAAKLQSCRDL